MDKVEEIYADQNHLLLKQVVGEAAVELLMVGGCWTASRQGPTLKKKEKKKKRVLTSPTSKVKEGNYYYYYQPDCKPQLIEQNAINPKAPAGKAIPRRKR